MITNVNSPPQVYEKEMLLLICLISAIPDLLYHCLFTILLLCFLLYSCKSPSSTNQRHSIQLKPQPKEQVPLDQVVTTSSTHQYSIMLMNTSSSCSHCRVMLAILLTLAITSHNGSTLEQDAQLLKPVASVVKSIVSMATMGSPTPIDFSSLDITRNLVSFVFRTGFPLTVPRSFFNNTQSFFNRLIDRIYAADVRNVGRKPLANLKLDMDSIVDSAVEQVRQSPDGLYTNYLDTLVNGQIPLEDALTQVGLQLKAYGIDLKNYRDIAAMVIGMPMVPELGAAASSVANLTPASLSALTDVTSKLIQTGAQMPGFALNAITSPVQSYESIRQLSPIPLPSSSLASLPFSLFQLQPKRQQVDPVN